MQKPSSCKQLQSPILLSNNQFNEVNTCHLDIHRGVSKLFIFISYSRQVKDKVQILSQDLQAIGHRVWLDRALNGGQDWWDEIMETIRGCDLFIFTLSPESIDSKACSCEYNYASKLGKVILPVLISDGVSINVLPPDLSAIQYVDYRKLDKEAALSLFRALIHLPSPKPLPDPLPEPPPVPITYLSSIKDQVETEKPLSFEEQSAIFLKLKELYGDSDASNDSLNLLKRFRKRTDLFARIAVEIDNFLQLEIPPKPPPNENALNYSLKPMFCRKCKAKLIPNAKFCNKCGTKVN